MLLKNKTAKTVALGGIICALSLLFMFMTGLFPFAEYTLPALSGIVLVALVIEINKKTAYIAYIAVGILSLLVAPIKESAVLFILLLGYYPILKSSIEKVKSRVLEWVIKMALFNLTILGSYLAMTYILGMGEVFSSMGSAFQYGELAFLLLANVTFIMYDIALTGLISMYYQRIRPKLKAILK